CAQTPSTSRRAAKTTARSSPASVEARRSPEPLSHSLTEAVPGRTMTVGRHSNASVAGVVERGPG
ncbi:MAG: hypothetical protein AVDCRST_MAG10-169, partial [uncultured Acidimicrobiales bacterium]